MMNNYYIFSHWVITRTTGQPSNSYDTYTRPGLDSCYHQQVYQIVIYF